MNSARVCLSCWKQQQNEGGSDVRGRCDCALPLLLTQLEQAEYDSVWGVTRDRFMDYMLFKHGFCDIEGGRSGSQSSSGSGECLHETLYTVTTDGTMPNHEELACMDGNADARQACCVEHEKDETVVDIPLNDIGFAQ